MVFRFLVFLFCLFIFSADSFASEVYSYSKNNGVIGEIKTYAVKGDESLIEIARKFGIGYNEITEANPRLDPFIPAARLFGVSAAAKGYATHRRLKK
jgi:L,D-transpeptidase ErfK/SrfK